MENVFNDSDTKNRKVLASFETFAILNWSLEKILKYEHGLLSKTFETKVAHRSAHT